MNQARNFTVASVSIAWVAIIAVAAMHMPPDEAEANTARSLSPNVMEAVPEFARAQVRADVLPSYLTSGDRAASELVTTTARALGERDGAKHWVVADEAGETCLVTVLTQAPDTASMACQPEQQLLRSGLALQVSNDDQATRTHLIPDGYAMGAPGLQVLGDRLLTGSPERASAAATLQPEPRTASLARDGQGSPTRTHALTLPAMGPMAPGH